MYYTDDPLWDADRYQAEQDEELAKLPRCSECDEPIQDDHCYEFNGELICETCLRDYHRVDTERYVV